MSDTLMTDGATPTAATPQDATSTTPAEVTTTQPTDAPGATDQQPAADKPADQATDTKTDEKSDADKVPETYDLKAPEGIEIPTEVITKLSDFAKANGLTQKQAQAMIDLRAEGQKAQAEQLAQARVDWENQSKADKELGGDKFPENLALCKKALDTFGTQELRDLLNDSGLGNHPEMIRAFLKVGQAISEDRFVPAKGAAQAQASMAQRMYPNMNP